MPRGPGRRVSRFVRPGARGAWPLRALAVLWILGAAGPGRAEVRFVDAVVAEVDGTVVTASDVALARALGLFALGPAAGPLSAPEVERYVDGRLLVREAARIGVEGTAVERAEAWTEAAARAGGEAALGAWLAAAGVDVAWARRMVDDDLGARRFVELRFRALAFVSEGDVSAALGPGPHGDVARETTRARLTEEAARGRLAEWLAEARARGSVRRLVGEGGSVPDPIPGLPGRAP